MPNKFVYLLAFIPLYQAWDLATLYATSGVEFHLIVETIASLAFLYILSLFIREQRLAALELADLRESVNTAQRALQERSTEAKSATRDFLQLIGQQFDAWNLTVSEKDVALLLIKGLSLEEIASVRESKSKTVRQHAANVYAKAGLDGRHQLAAYFLEDLMAPAIAE
jgi:DNA-binding CsgD family transcriptional regulator